MRKLRRKGSEAGTVPKVVRKTKKSDVSSVTLQAVPDVMAVLELSENKLFSSPHFGWGGEIDSTIVPEDALESLHPDDQRRFLTVIQETQRSGLGHRTEYSIRLRDGSVRHVEASGTVVRDEHGSPSKIVVVARDITDRKESEKPLLHYQAIVESSSDIIIGMSLEGMIESWNPAAERTYQYRGAEAVGQHISMLAPPERKEEIPSILERIKRGETIPPFETERVRKDGTHVDIQLTVSPVMDPQGRIKGGSVIARDIAEVKELRAMLRRRESELSEFIEHVHAGLHWVTPEGIIFRINEVAAEMLGYTSEECIGQSFPRLFADTASAERITRSLATGEELYSFQTMLRCKDGSVRSILLDSRFVMREGTLEYGRFLIRDITEWTRLREARALKEPVPGVRTMVPLCAWCRNVRLEEGEWIPLEVYLEEHLETEVTHGICPRCISKHHRRTRGSTA